LLFQYFVHFVFQREVLMHRVTIIPAASSLPQRPHRPSRITPVASSPRQHRPSRSGPIIPVTSSQPQQPRHAATSQLQRPHRPRRSGPTTPAASSPPQHHSRIGPIIPAAADASSPPQHPRRPAASSLLHRPCHKITAAAAASSPRFNRTPPQRPYHPLAVVKSTPPNSRIGSDEA